MRLRPGIYLYFNRCHGKAVLSLLERTGGKGGLKIRKSALFDPLILTFSLREEGIVL
jgi:hypothetical protein